MTGENERPELEFLRECVMVSRRWRQRIDERLRPEGLTFARMTVLWWIDYLEGPVTQRVLADNVGIEGPTLVRQLHALEEQGLVERVPYEGDRRAKGLKLTPAARPMIDKLMEVVHGACDDYLAGLDRRRLGSATRLLADARATLE